VPSSGPFRLDFDRASFSGGIVVEAAPVIVFGARHKAPHDRVTVDVANLFDPFLLGVDVEVVVASLPELFLTDGLEFA
jgi:hypothetical protein